MGTEVEKIKAIKTYIETVVDWCNVPQRMYGDHEDRRVAAHEDMLDKCGCDPGDLKLITDNLDIWIGMPLYRGNMPDISEAQINQFTLKLHTILESKKFKEEGYCWVSDETKRLRKGWWAN